MAEFLLFAKRGIHLIVEEPADLVVGSFYMLAGQPGWWWGHAFARVQTLHLPDAEPLDVAVELLRPTPGRNGAIRLPAPASGARMALDLARQRDRAEATGRPLGAS
ncbi:hypothetical protein ACQEU6_08705 [Spirillospora sp. CA-108201]